MRLIAWGRTSVLAFVFTACGSGGASEGDEASRGGSSAGQPSATTSGSATGGASLAGAAANAGSNASGAPIAGSSGSPAAGGGAADCRENAPDEEWDANCLACAAGDACASCACQNCAVEIRGCEDTSGCLEIAACVKSASCVGVECYCGTDTAAACANGGGNGPCKEAILNAPGGKAPTLAQPSAGPASDAVAALATCMQGPSTCSSVCN